MSTYLLTQLDHRFPNAPEVRRSRRLVVSSIATVENYEYGYFWYFYQDGNIEFEVKLTGSLSLGVYPKNESQPAKPKYGTMINERLYAPIHQHFFNVRLDFALDQQNNGQDITNTAQVVDVVQEPEGHPDNEFENAFFAQTTSLKSEKQARMNMCLEKMRTWKVINPNVHNHVGDAVGYKLVPGNKAYFYPSKQLCASICLYVCPSVCLYVCKSICTYVRMAEVCDIIRFMLFKSQHFPSIY